MSTQDLSSEISNDNMNIGYSTMNDREVSVAIENRNGNNPITIEQKSISGAEIVNSIVPSEFNSLQNATKENVRWVTQLGDSIDISTGSNTRQVLLNAFGPGTSTRSNLVEAVQTEISRADQLRRNGKNIPSPVREYDVTKARSM